MPLTLGQIAAHVSGVLHGDPQQVVVGLGSIKDASDQELTFVARPKFIRELAECSAAGVLLNKYNEDYASLNQIVVPNAYLAYAQVTSLFDDLPKYSSGIASSAVIDEQAQVHESAYIGPHCVVEAGAVIGAGTSLIAGVFVGAKAVLGEDCLLFPNTVVYHNCI